MVGKPSTLPHQAVALLGPNRRHGRCPAGKVVFECRLAVDPYLAGMMPSSCLSRMMVEDVSWPGAAAEGRSVEVTGV